MELDCVAVIDLITPKGSTCTIFYPLRCVVVLFLDLCHCLSDVMLGLSDVMLHFSEWNIFHKAV